MLTAAGRRWRLAITVVVLALLLAGTLVGQDDAFPFGPFRMYATRDAPNGLVLSTRVEAVDATGRVLVVPDSATGLRRAEIEGQVARFRADPALLGEISRAHSRLHPSQPAYDEVRVVERRYRLEDSRPTGEQTDQVVAQWHR
ncbi:MAG: hypothetical protein JWO88_1118 [Frankiales bacterium]|nr:hypothetical protein [Frankiales bacterium]